MPRQQTLPGHEEVRSRSGRVGLGGTRQGDHAQLLPQAAWVIDVGELQPRAEGIHQVHQQGLQGPGQCPAQGATCGTG